MNNNIHSPDRQKNNLNIQVGLVSKDLSKIQENKNIMSKRRKITSQNMLFLNGDTKEATFRR